MLYDFQIKLEAETEEVSVQSRLHQILRQMAASTSRGGGSVASLTSDLHVWPDYHGNRCPLADPNLRGMFTGLTLSTGTDDLALKYLATVQALAYGTRLIVEHLQK